MANINGTSGDDILSGTPDLDSINGGLGNDRIDAGAGDDFISGSGGDDILDGGAGFDTVFLDNFVSTNPVQINLLTGTATGPESGNDTLINIEHVMASGIGDITIIGSNGDDVLQAYGYARNVISAGAGDDIVGDMGHASILDGGSGRNGLGLYRDQTYDGQSIVPIAAAFTQTFTPGVNGTLADGTSYSNFDFFLLYTGSGDDNVTFNQLKRRPSSQSFFGNWWNAGDGNDTVTVDQSSYSNALQMTPATDGTATLLDGTGELITFQLVENYRLIAGSGNDRLTTGAGSDVFMGNGGDDVLDGAGGADMARYSGLSGNYSITQLSATSFKVTDLRAGSPDGTDTLSNIERLQWGDGSITRLNNSPPTVITDNVSGTRNQTFALSSLVSVSDVDGDAITRYQIYDANSDPNSGHFLMNGQPLAARTVIDLTPAQLSQVSFVTGKVDDPLQIRAFDGASWSAADAADWAPFTVSVPRNWMPQVITWNTRLAAGQVRSASSLLGISDHENDPIILYQLYDNTSDPSSGHFLLNGQTLPARQVIELTAAQMAQATFVAGTVNDDLQIRAFDGVDWSAAANANWAPFTIGPSINNPPTVNINAGATATAGQIFPLQNNLVFISDIDNDAITRYQIYDNNDDPNSGHFSINGVAQAARIVIDLSPAQFAQTTFVAGAHSDTLQIRAFDGIAWSAADNADWAPFTVTLPANRAPVLTTQTSRMAAGQTLSLASLLSISDADGDAMIRYQLYDNSSDPNSGHFAVNGQVQSAHIVLDLSAAQAAQTTFVTGTVNDDLQVRVFDGQAWSAADTANWAPFTIGPLVNRAPVATTHMVGTLRNQTLALSLLASVSDADSDAITRYQLYDNSSDPNSGHFVVNGQVQSSHIVIDLTPAQAAQTSFVAGTVSDDLQIRVFDGISWSAGDTAAWSPFTVMVPANAPPRLGTTDMKVAAGQILALSSLFLAFDDDNDPLTRYQLYDNSSDPNSGHFVVNGQVQSSHIVIDLTSAQAAQTTFVTGTVNDDLQIRVFDGMAWSAADSAAWAPFTIGPANHAPILTTSDMRVAAGQVTSLAGMLSISDADGDAMTRYQLYDNSSDPNSGHFIVNGQAQSSRVVIDLTAAQAAQTGFITGTVNDDLQIRVFDGAAWSAADSANWAPFAIGPTTNHAPKVFTNTLIRQPNQTLSLSSLLAVSDDDGDAMTRYQLWDDTPDSASGHFVVNGVTQPARSVIDITAAQLNQTTFVTGTVADALQIRAFDGRAWSAPDSANWAPFQVNVS